MSNKSRVYILFHVVITTLLLFFFFGSPWLFLILLLPISYLILGLKGKSDKDA